MSKCVRSRVAGSPLSFNFYRYSRVLSFRVGERFNVSLSATPGQYVAFSCGVGRLGITLSAGRRITRESSGTERGYKHTKFGVECGIGWTRDA